jgi:hypothetical protein
MKVLARRLAWPGNPSGQTETDAQASLACWQITQIVHWY